MSDFVCTDQSFFASQPSTPKSGSTLSKGAQIYQSYMTNTNTWRLRKGRTTPPGDAAGLVTGTKYHFTGRKHYEKERQDPLHLSQDWVSSRSLVPGQSFAGERNFLKHDVPDDGFYDDAGPGQGSPMRPSTAPRRICIRLTDQSFRSNLDGSGLDVTLVDPAIRRMKATGDFSPKIDTGRTLFQQFSEGNSNEASEVPTGAIKWNKQFTLAKETFESMRPKTAPSEGGRMTQARRYYHEVASVGHQDVLQYRHSGGICPDEFKLEASTRQRGTPLVVKPAGSPKDVFNDARSAYSLNRVQALMCSTTFN